MGDERFHAAQALRQRVIGISELLVAKVAKELETIQ